ncbi:SdrD B-like domain-containing protein [Spirosoma areae]
MYTLTNRLSYWITLVILCSISSVVQAQSCSININQVTVSGCYSVSGANQATVSVEVAWSNAPANDYIVVSTGAQSRTITPGLISVTYPQVVGSLTGQTTIVTPQVVAFEVDANGATGSITATFVNNPTCQTTSSYTAPPACPPTACAGTNLGGMVFKDFNDNGLHEAGEGAGLPGSTVKAIACDGTVYSTTTDAYGRYSLPVPTGKYPVRVEFSNVMSPFNLGVNGADSRSTVQFVNGPDCTVDLGIFNPLDYCSNTPQIFVPCYVNGDPLIAGSSAAESPAFVSFPYGVSSLTFEGENMLALAGQIGTTWGVAYNRATKKIFQSAVLKRHAGLGPAGLGGIYVTDFTNPGSSTTTTFLSVSDIGIDVGTIASNADRGLPGDKTQSSYDPQTFSQIGKIGIGDLEITEDGNKLWLMNLNDMKLYSIDITRYNQDGTTKPTAANVSSFAVPASCTNGSFRPWALKVYNGKVYVGGVCDAQTSGNKSDLRASVYELNGSTFTQIFDFPLTYPKGYPARASLNITGWFPWTDTFTDLLDGTNLRHPVPIFTDIEFDVDGSMVLAFGDRTGFQGGDRNYRPDDLTSTTLYQTNSQAGDVLRAYYSNGAFVLENNAKAGPATGYGTDNAQGPGFGEFYNDNWIQENGTVLYHAENAMGGLALKPGSGEVVVTTVDPVDQHPFAGGVRYLNNTTGQVTGSYAVYITRGPDGSPNPGTFAKATGLGDIELSCNTITLLEIGNRVWQDNDLDGVQDACEPPLPNVVVSLYKNGTLVATTTTDASGEYYFSSKSKLTIGNWNGTDADTALLDNTAYQVVFGSTQFTSNRLTVDGKPYVLTQANSATTNANDSNDSDALVSILSGVTAPIISLTTGAVGQSNHTYDAGFYPLASLGDFVFEDANRNGQQDPGDLPIPGVTVTLLSSGTVVATTTTNASGLYSFTGLTPGVPYSVSFTAPAGYTATLQNTGNDAKDSDGNPMTGLTGTYSLTAGENNPTIDMGYVRPASLGNFVFVDTNRDGLQDAGDTPILGVVVTLISNGTVVATTTTNASGLYSFTGLTPGVPYSVSFTTPTGYTATTSNTGTNDAIDSDPVGGITAPVTLTSGENNTTLDAGFYLKPAGLGDFVFVDANKNGVQDTGESPIAGVTVTLYTNGVVSATTTTNASGLYSFTGLTPGSSLSYSVGFSAPGGYTATAANQGSDDAKDSDADVLTGRTQSVTLAPGEFNPTLDAGFYIPSASLGDFVFVDTDKDGLQDSGEPGIPGVVVVLLTGTNTPVGSTTTNASGLYSFTGLTPGIPYSVSFVSPAGYTSTSANQGGNDALDSDADPLTGKTQSVTLAPGENNPTLDAGFYLPTLPNASLGDFVFEDMNRNGQQDTGEPGIPNATVTLISNGTVVATTTTNASGLYSFTGLIPGVPYSVSFTAPPGYTATVQNSGNDAADSDGNPATGLTGTYSLTANENNPTVDMGYYRPAPMLSIDKLVDKTKAKLGDVLTYTLVLTNTGTVPATNVVVRDSSTAGLAYVANSATAPAGTTFTQGRPISTWTVANLPAGQRLTLTFQAIADSSGILYNRATIPGDTATVCTSIPVKVCAGEVFTVELTAASGRTSYRWFRNNVELAGQTTNVLSVTSTGTYSLAIDNQTGLCPDFSCCPFIVEADTLPTFVAMALPGTCTGSTPQATGKLVLSQFRPGYTYQYSLGTDFNPAASLSGAAQPIPGSGVLVSTLANPTTAQAYTVRVYNSSGCYTDVTVVLLPTVCECPAPVCVPVVVSQTKRAKRIGDVR